MGLFWRKRVRLGENETVNLSKRGASVSKRVGRVTFNGRAAGGYGSRPACRSGSASGDEREGYSPHDSDWGAVMGLMYRKRQTQTRVALRAFIAMCAFAGAGFLGLWVHDTGWSSDYTPIVVAAVIGGLVVAFIDTGRRR
jgi:hypothetical protein